MARMTRREATLGLAAAGSLASPGALALPADGRRYDLVVAGGEVIDPSQGLRARRDIAIRGGRIAEVEASIASVRTERVVSAAGRLVVPGLVDLHAHVMPADDSTVAYGAHIPAHGATTLVSAGDVGADRIADLRRQIADHIDTRVLAFLNVARTSRPGTAAPELCNIELAAIDATAEALAANADLLLGLKVRLTPNVVERHGIAPIVHAIRACERAGTGGRVMCHAASLAEAADIGRILDALRPGDILTGCYGATACIAGRRSGIVQDGRVHPSAVAAKRRGVLFDVGHGGAGFDFAVAEAAIEAGVPPDIVSTDMHVLAMGAPGLPTLPAVMTKMLALGFPLADVISMASTAPARIVGRTAGLGTLQIGAPADLTLLEHVEGPVVLADTRASRRGGRVHLKAAGTVVAGMPR